MPSIPDEQKPAISKIIAPKVLFWFRWAAFATIITGLIVAYLNGYLHQSMTLGIGSGGGKNTAIGIGMWLGIVMAYNVWFIIWPNQKKALGIVEVPAEEKPIAAKSDDYIKSKYYCLYQCFNNGSCSKPLLYNFFLLFSLVFYKKHLRSLKLARQQK